MRLDIFIKHRLVRYFAVLSIVAAFGASIADANQELALQPKSDSDWKQAVNQGTVRILTKGLGCTCTVIASDMASVLNKGAKRRILPVIGHGSLQGIADVIYLAGIDLSIIQADVLSYVQRNKIHQNIEDRVRYVTRLYSSEVHLIAGEGIKTIQDLEGKVVSYGVKGRGSMITAENLFASLGIEVLPVYVDHPIAVEKIRNGEIAAAFAITGKPATAVLNIRPGDGLHFVPVPINQELAETYVPATLTHDDYPNLVEADSDIETIAVPEVLAVYNWDQKHERYAKVASVVEALFDNFGEFLDPIRHPKWQDVDLRAELPGWQRFKPAQDWLDRHPGKLAWEEQKENASVAELPDYDGVNQGPVKRIKSSLGQEVVTPALATEGNITNPLHFDVSEASSSEGDQKISFDISMSRPNKEEVRLFFSTINGAAKGDVDFEWKNGVLVIEPGVTKTSLDIEILDDDILESDEDFSLLLAIDPTLADAAYIAPGPYKAVIMDND